MKLEIKKTIKRDINTEKLRNGTDSEYKKELEKLEDILKKYNIEDETERSPPVSAAL